MDESSTTGEALTFSAYRPFEDPKSAPFSSQYLARRNADSGWLTEAISPPQEGEAFINPLLAVDNLYRAFSPDLQTAWLQTDTEPTLAPEGVPGHPNLYRRNSSGGGYEACTTRAPLISDEETHGPQLQGFSANGSLAVFRIESRLTEDSSEVRKQGGQPIYQLYVCSYEGGVAKLRLLSVLPNGEASDLENTIGGPANEAFQGDQGRTESLENAVSADGSRVFWTASEGIDAGSPGALYVRSNPSAAPAASGHCEESEPQAACTVLIDPGPARFWTAADDGSVAIFATSSRELSEYVVGTGETNPIAPQVVGVLGASEDASRVYFISEADIEGQGTSGEPNLYLYEQGAPIAFIATLSARDAAQGSAVPSPGNAAPAFHTARVTPDGSAVAFMSNDSTLASDVAGYDNIDQLTGKPAAEVYRYSIGGHLACISCNRTGARPIGREIQNKFLANSPVLPAAALLPPWLNSLYATRDFSSDGKRVFFEGFEPLVPSDTNGKADVYEWEQRGTGSCEETDSTYNPGNGGCVALVTSGRESTDSQFVDASPDGRDVFVRTAASLVAWDPGQIDIYDAREGGGLPPPVAALPECEGEACQSTNPPPSPQTPASTQPGPGNLVEAAARPKTCPKGKRKVKKHGKTSCVKKKAKHKRHAKKSGRPHR
jgi:hypothetical protein